MEMGQHSIVCNKQQQVLTMWREIKKMENHHKNLRGSLNIDRV
jgi:hypothetical protein